MPPTRFRIASWHLFQPFLSFTVSLACLLTFLCPALLEAQQGQPTSGAPPVASPLVREGDFAVGLEQALGVGMAQDEVEAETLLGNLGITPRNGWIADYPVTPDIIGELQDALANAVAAGKLPLSREDALTRLASVSAQVGLGVTPYAGGTYQTPPSAESYPSPAAMNDYYYSEGPPIVTYYSPPPDYYYLYSWVPYPFFVSGFFFPGFFVLHDFHRSVVVHGRPVFVSNHFNDIRAHRVFRVGPDARFNGRTFAGIGAPRGGSFISTGVPRSGTAILNAPRARPAPGMTARSFQGGPVPSHGGPAPGGSFHGGVAHGGPAPSGGFHAGSGAAPGGGARGGSAGFQGGSAAHGAGGGARGGGGGGHGGGHR